MRKIIVMAIIALLMVFTVSATDIGIVNEDTRIWTTIVQENAFYNSEYVVVSIYNSNSTLEFYNNMTKLSDGIYYIDYNFTQIGNHLITIDIYNQTDGIVAIGATSMYIEENIEIQINNIFGGKTMEVFLMMAIFALLYIIGYFTKSYGLIIASGVISLSAIFTIRVIADANLNAIFWIGLTMISIYHGIYLIINNPNRKKFVRKKDE
jgi:hypothetical protein